LLLATLWFPDTNPVGPASLWPAVLIASYALVACRWRSRVIFVGAPFIFLILAVLSDGCPFPFRRRFPDADDFVGYYLLCAASGVSAMELARIGRLTFVLLAAPVLFISGWLLVGELGEWLVFRVFGRADSGSIVLGKTMLWMPLFCAACWRMSFPYRVRLRVNHGHCSACGYDLRESPDRCPECGAAPAAADRAVGVR
jgi:hypothetical protein